MRKYWNVMKVTFSEYFVSRVSFVLWRVRVVLTLLITYFLWNALFDHRPILFGYTKEQMITYILIAGFISTFSLGTRTYEISEQILNGNIINSILKPVSFFKYHLSRDFADKILNLLFSLVEITILVLLLKPHLFWQSDLNLILLSIFFIIIGAVIAFFINISLSFIAFLTTETWAPRFIFYIVVSYLAGVYFPLDIMPKPVYYFALLTPLPYLYYLPVKIYIKGVDGTLSFEIVMSLVWVVVMGLIARTLWQRGLKTYNFFGR